MTKLFGAIDSALAPTPLNMTRGEAREERNRENAELPAGALPACSCVLITSSGEPIMIPAIAPMDPAPAFNKNSPMLKQTFGVVCIGGGGKKGKGEGALVAARDDVTRCDAQRGESMQEYGSK